ncbi:hypothetical protein [Bradyrhizobium sp. DASA03007]|uniref:hypothetical protein n=1 Tax=unclassified Bradyrhizobium TaxID=2631580 RepID=UPI003F6FD24D
MAQRSLKDQIRLPKQGRGRPKTQTVWSERTRLARAGAEKRGLSFEIDAEYIEQLFAVQEGKCAISGLPLIIDWAACNPTASLDRRDSSRGYIKGNVQWVHKVVNEMKWDYSEDYFVAMCMAVAAHYRPGEVLSEKERAALAGQPQSEKPHKARNHKHDFKTDKKVAPPKPEEFVSAGGMLF